MWGGGNVEKMTPPFSGSKIMNLLVFFDFEPKKRSRVPTPWGLYGAEWDQHGAFGDLGDPMVPTLKGVSGDSICLLGYERTFFAVSSFAEGRSQPVPKTRNDCFHQ